MAGRRRREAVGAFNLVLEAARSKSIELNALKAGILLSPEAPRNPEPVRLTMALAIEQYLEYVKTQRSLRTTGRIAPPSRSCFANPIRRPTWMKSLAKTFFGL